ncbi:hypothetical protein SFUMM280S_01552 [Streptomyces fumanus]
MLLLVIAGALALTSLVRIITGADGITNVSRMSTALQLAVPIGLAGLGGLWPSGRAWSTSAWRAC